MAAVSGSMQKRSTEGCSKFKSPETRQVQERLVSTLEHMQVPKWDLHITFHISLVYHFSCKL